ncbi:hypothetical protein K6U06_20165 [Acidiferrimicrobium sp. IK]|uniref:hypothetical protein n=1 Tax=Acidiferrimicrobium sp. IK TaxID=2871700 RepID=UPI0021CB6176|nr:hypothetical protein [Acidiferrimicrobium sp. IK]MCU4186690.1 hypothetical protein [Acidiferrimicrobium sp. IK]
MTDTATSASAASDGERRPVALSSRPLARGMAVLGVAAVLTGVLVWAVFAYLRSSVPSVDFTKTAGPVNLRVQTVAAIGFGPHPTWVSYLVQDPSGKWVHSTIWQLPADRQINVTVDEYDSGGALRNSLWGGITGTLDSQATVNGKPTSVVDPAAGNGIAHTFNVPDLGINVPLYGISSKAKNPCSAAPCDTSSDHTTITFSFHTPAGGGDYRWQCFVPCGLAYLNGNGGPMAAIGFMSGFLKVVA